MRWLKQLDQILRGELTRPDALQSGRFQFSAVGVSIVAVVLAMLYGACMGAYSVFRILDDLQYPESFRQLTASAVKTPALFFLTLVITFPSLYVFNALVGSRLRFFAVLRLLVASSAVNLAVLSSLGPIVAFFSLSTNSYVFMVLLNVAVFALAGLLGLLFLLQTLNRLQYATDERRPGGLSPPVIPKPEPDQSAGAAPEAVRADVSPSGPAAIDSIEGHTFGRHVKLVFGIWIVVFGLVGAQMGWILRPFIGSPNEEFRWFRNRESNFFQAVGNAWVEAWSGSSAEPSTEDKSRSRYDDPEFVR